MAFVNLHQKPKHHGKQVAGVAAGAALIGAAGAVLLTPKSGKEVRRDIAKGGRAAAGKAVSTVRSVENKLSRKPADAVPKPAAAAKTAATKAKTTTARNSGSRKPRARKPTT